MCIHIYVQIDRCDGDAYVKRCIWSISIRCSFLVILLLLYALVLHRACESHVDVSTMYCIYVYVYYMYVFIHGYICIQGERDKAVLCLFAQDLPHDECRRLLYLSLYRCLDIKGLVSFHTCRCLLVIIDDVYTRGSPYRPPYMYFLLRLPYPLLLLHIILCVV